MSKIYRAVPDAYYSWGKLGEVYLCRMFRQLERFRFFSSNEEGLSTPQFHCFVFKFHRHGPVKQLDFDDHFALLLFVFPNDPDNSG
jgi:hypothetical protein